ncbi:MAG: HAMP domain-containing sensor histidine kinase [Alcanivoracaceae bacterium]|nr:HAMP domain-containing sensor histidine kinase [Alcanivoracaceae bacterium]
MYLSNYFGRQSLSRQIVAGFIILSMLVGGSLSVGIFRAMIFVERGLISEGLERELDHYLSDPYYRKFIDRSGKYLVFEQDSGSGSRVPAWLEGLDPGFHEAFNDGSSYHAWVRTYHGVKYFLLSDQTEFEQEEREIFIYISLGFLLSMFAAYLLARFIARQVSAPVVLLEESVAAMSDPRSNGVIPVENFNDDEVGRLARSFQQIFKRYRAALEREQNFSADLSHELRTPVMIITSACELLLLDRDINHAARRRIEGVREASRQMQMIVKALLVLLRNQHAEESGFSVRPLSEILHAVTGSWEETFRDAGMDFSLCVDHEPTAAIPMPEIVVELILANLLRNARDHAAAGCVCVRVGAGWLAVEDSGVGIPEDRMDDLTGRFSSGHIFSENSEHLGMGLSLVGRLCEMMGWTFRLSRSPEGGASASVAFR